MTETEMDSAIALSNQLVEVSVSSATHPTTYYTPRDRAYQVPEQRMGSCCLLAVAVGR